MKKLEDLKWAFFSYGHNLGDFTRALETAIGMQNSGAQVKFFNHGGVHNHRIAEAGLGFEDLQPELTWEQHEIIMDINRYKAKVGTPLPITEDQWVKMAEADLEAFDRYQPDGVYAGLNLSCFISVPYAKLPMVTQVPTVNCPSFIENEMYNMPNTMERNFFMQYVFPGKLKRRLMRKVLMGDSAKASLTTFNAARKKFGLPPIYNIVKLLQGDLTLLPDMPELSGLPEEKLTKGYHYTGPIFSKMNLLVPEEVKEVFGRSGINIFCSLGSSGYPETLKLIIKTLRNNPNYNVVCSTTTIVKPEELGANSERFFATEFLPAHVVNEMADIAITHGGQGTIQTAVWCGTPVIGIGFQGEQQANIDGIAAQGMAIRVPIFEVSAKKIEKTIKKINTPKYLQNAQRMKQLIRSTDGVKSSVDLMNEFLLNRIN